MKNDLLIMLRVLLLGLFVWATLVWSFAFTCVFWVLIGILAFAGWKEAKDARNKRIADNIDKLDELRKLRDTDPYIDAIRNQFGTPFDENLYKGDVFPEPNMDVVSKKYPTKL